MKNIVLFSIFSAWNRGIIKIIEILQKISRNWKTADYTAMLPNSAFEILLQLPGSRVYLGSLPVILVRAKYK